MFGSRHVTGRRHHRFWTVRTPGVGGACADLRAEPAGGGAGRIVLLAADGLTNRENAGRLSIDPDTVKKWRSRFALQGLVGLEDRSRPGRPLV